MMKKILAFSSLLCLSILFLLASCGKKDDLPKIKGSLDIIPYKTALTVKSNFEDTDNHDLYVGNVKVSVLVTTTEDDQVKEVGKKPVSVTIPSFSQYVENVKNPSVVDAVPGEGQFLVTFNTNGGTKVASQAISSGKKVSAPSVPTKAGFIFAGWFTNEECTTQYDFSKVVESNLTLYAKWNPVAQYTVTFNTNGGSDISNRIVNEKTRVSRPTDPTKEYHTFGGWFTNEECSEAFDFNTNIEKDITLYAKWTSYEKSLSGASVDFTSLTAGNKYTVKLIISSGGNQMTLDTKEVQTIENGESKEDPIIITNLEQLQGMNKSADSYYELGADIDLGGEQLPSIFSSSTFFTGHFDGKGHKISNFTLYANNSYIGLFSYMSGATIENLVIEGVTYDKERSDTYLGVLAGYAKHCNISNVTINNVSLKHGGTGSRTSYVGGLIGLAENCSIRDCEVNQMNLEIKKAQLKVYVGGLIGTNNESSVQQCVVLNSSITASIYYNSYDDGRIYLGGFVGVNDTLTNGIEDCYAETDLTIKENSNSTSSSGNKTYALYVGGFAGGNVSASAKFKNCATNGKIDVTAEYAYNVYIGGFIASLSTANLSKLENCLYYPKETGITVVLMPPKASQKDTSVDNPDVKPEDENKIEQKAFISMTIGNKGKGNYVNVVAYGTGPVLAITNQHENTIINVMDNEQSTDLTAFSDFIKNLLSESN